MDRHAKLQHRVSFVQEELDRCLDLAPGESCTMACQVGVTSKLHLSPASCGPQDFPDLQAALKCDGANLTGQNAERC